MQGIERPDAETAPAAILVRDLAYRYPDGRHALRNVAFTIKRGEAVALIGPNGAGKSTLLWHLNGLLPGKARDRGLGHSHGSGAPQHRPAEAKPAVWIDGLEVNSSAKRLREIRRRVGLLFQDPDDQLFSATVIEDVAFGPLNLGKTSAEAKRIAQECLERVDLAQIADRPPHHLSFGERKRACLAGLLACDPIVLALDEPTANLDPRARRRFMALIRDLDCAKLIATHDLDMAAELCDRAILLDSGDVIADGPAREVLSQETMLLEHGLEMPLSLKLAQ